MGQLHVVLCSQIYKRLQQDYILITNGLQWIDPLFALEKVKLIPEKKYTVSISISFTTTSLSLAFLMMERTLVQARSYILF